MKLQPMLTQRMNQIVVIDQGHIVQHGTHEELAKKEGVYRTFLECREKSISWKL